MVFKKDKMELSVKITKDPKKGFIRKNTIFKVLIKDKKGNAKAIAQCVCNIADLVCSPDKANSVFEQRINLKFHKAYYDSGAQLLKQHATLNLNVKSSLDSSILDQNTPRTPMTDMTCSQRFLSDIDDSYVFDIDDNMMMNSQINDLSMMSMGSASKPNENSRPTDILNSGSQSFRSVRKGTIEGLDKGRCCSSFSECF
jgi:hypothetical protein